MFIIVLKNRLLVLSCLFFFVKKKDPKQQNYKIKQIRLKETEFVKLKDMW